MKRRLSFSLIEVMIVLCLIASIGFLSSYALVPLYRTYQARLEVEKIYELLQEVQIESLALESDMKVSFKKINQTWWIETETNERILGNQRIKLPHIKNITMKKAENPALFSISFYRNGWIEPQTWVSMSIKNETIFIDFSSPPIIKKMSHQPVSKAVSFIPPTDIEETLLSSTKQAREKIFSQTLDTKDKKSRKKDNRPFLQ
jgi:type II secretory pathway pseudopilin PulG